MKKQIPPLLLCGAVLLSSCGCGQTSKRTSSGAKEYALYYEVRDLNSVCGGDAMGKETISVIRPRKDTTEHEAKMLLDKLLSGPTDEKLESLIPDGTKLLDFRLNGNHAMVDLSSAYGTLSGISLTMADYSITLTLTQLPKIQTVSVTVSGQELGYRDVHNFSVSDILHSSTEDVVGTLTASLYFPDENGALSMERRTLELYEGDTQVEVVVKALQEGPENEKLKALFPKGFSIHSVWMEDDVCCVNLSSSALEKLPDGSDLKLTLRGLTHSLRALNTVSSVEYLEDGKTVSVYGGVNLGDLN